MRIQTESGHLRIMFDRSHCQNTHSKSQHCCFKEFSNFLHTKKVPQSVCLLEGGRLKRNLAKFSLSADLFSLGLPLSDINFNPAALLIMSVSSKNLSQVILSSRRLPSLLEPTASRDYYPDKLWKLPLPSYLGGAKGGRRTLTSICCRSDQV